MYGYVVLEVKNHTDNKPPSLARILLASHCGAYLVFDVKYGQKPAMCRICCVLVIVKFR